LPTASVLVAQQSQMVTPRRMSQFVERDSILDSTAFNEDLFSPAALKKQIEAKRKENGNENIKEEEEE
jgi:hypothetical protein